jgi:hypothetical protein
MEMIEPSSEYRDATGYNHERGMPHESVTLAIAVSRETCAEREKTEIRSSVTTRGSHRSHDRLRSRHPVKECFYSDTVRVSSRSAGAYNIQK